MSKSYSLLKSYLLQKMRMSHVYQPVMIRAMLKSEDLSVSAEVVARHILKYDASQIEYYISIVKNMPGKVLTKNGILTKKADKYSLVADCKNLSESEKKSLIGICEKKINEYLEKRGEQIWNHRRRGYRPVSGSVRFKVLRSAGYKCQLCGISADERAIDVDHIIPRSLGGPDSLENYQALCYKCNTNKRNTDSTDFRQWQTVFSKREKKCLFCALPDKRIVGENALAICIEDGFPVTEGHSLVIPKRHVESGFDLYDPEFKACMDLLKNQKSNLESFFNNITGFNIGLNSGESAGQTIFHCHWHLIPRRKNDVPNPKGGVRHVIPGKGNY